MPIPLSGFCALELVLMDSFACRDAYGASSGVVQVRFDRFNNARQRRLKLCASVTMWMNSRLVPSGLLPGPQQRGFVHNYPHEFNDLASWRTAISASFISIWSPIPPVRL
jgi:hypothetical protein